MRRSLALGAAMALTLATAAHAEGSARSLLEEFERGGQARSTAALVAQQAALGVSWSNTRLKTRSLPQMYCPPATLALTGADVIDLLRRAVEADRGLENAPYGLAILLAHERAYPCEGPARPAVG